MVELDTQWGRSAVRECSHTSAGHNIDSVDGSGGAFIEIVSGKDEWCGGILEWGAQGAVCAISGDEF
jgi:hypothetical protein